MKFVFRISGGIKFWDPVEDYDTGSPSSITVRREYLLAFQYWYCELCVENGWGGGRKNCFVNFCSLAVLESSVNEGWWVVTESLIWAIGNLKKLRAGILAEAISTTHSDMLYRLDICTFHFNEPLLFQIFVSWNLYKHWLSLVYYHFHHAFTVNNSADNCFFKYIFICFKYYTFWNQFFD